MTEKCAKNSPDLSDFGKEEIPSNVAFIPNENAQTMKMISTSKMVRSRVTATKYKVNESIYRQSFNQNCLVLQYHNNYRRSNIKALSKKFSVMARRCCA